jgi:protein TonB
MVGISVVILIHVLVIWALLSGLGKNVVQIIKKPLNATIIEEVKLPPPPPPPPPPPKRIVEPPKVPPPIDTYVPPPDIPPPVTQAAPPITAVTPGAAAAGIQDRGAAAAVVQAPPKPAIRRGISKIAGDDPSYPREAIRAGVQKGRVVARLSIDESGKVTEVNIVSSEPRGVFDKVVRAALETWKFKAEGEKYVGEVEINFSLKDE